ncbi:hypothetical protein K7432_007924 [Basidiobolus ranarum]|uniref:Uncharacterized protein n=1 Tax=Basidiobolus ranarum TaxID=34480 RepID=A0ABR2WSJ6_9FUNG
MVFFKSLYFLTVLLVFSTFLVSDGLKFSQTKECNTCLKALGGGCKKKIEKANSNLAASYKAMKDCLCTDKYFDNFDTCATCSLQSTGSEDTPGEKEKLIARKACVGFRN